MDDSKLALTVAIASLVVAAAAIVLQPLFQIWLSKKEGKLPLNLVFWLYVALQAGFLIANAKGFFEEANSPDELTRTAVATMILSATSALFCGILIIFSFVLRLISRVQDTISKLLGLIEALQSFNGDLIGMIRKLADAQSGPSESWFAQILRKFVATESKG